MSDDLSPRLRGEVKRNIARLMADSRKLQALASQPEAREKFAKTLGVCEREALFALIEAERQIRTQFLDPKQFEIKVRASTSVQFEIEVRAPSVPPRSACFLLDLFLAKADRAVIAGDIAEEFKEKLAVYTPTGARLWFWAETGRVIATRNPVCRWLLGYGFGRLVEWIFRTIGS